MRIVPLTLREANDFVEKWHRHSARTSNDGGKFAIGLEVAGQLVGAAIAGRPVARMLHVPGSIEVLRLCTSPDAPRGAGSKLYSRVRRIWQLMGGTTVHTYTLKHESGSTMRGAGIHEAAAETKPGQWTRPARPRQKREIYEQPKLRWSETLPELKIKI